MLVPELVEALPPVAREWRRWRASCSDCCTGFLGLPNASGFPAIDTIAARETSWLTIHRASIDDAPVQ
jgi:hypothetical protein